MIIIDGSEGEGGGQVVRNACALSLATSLPFRIINVRGKRKKPGLMRQHVTAIEAACKIGGGHCEGLSVGSPEILFAPGKVIAGEHRFQVGTAGSTGLVLQTILMPLAMANAPSRLVIEGGTHNMLAPPFDFIDRVFLPVINRMGPTVEARLIRHGFYPRGGGRIEIDITPAPLTPIECIDRGAPIDVSATVLIAGLQGDIAQRELKTARSFLDWPPEVFSMRLLPEDQGPGNILMLEARFEQAAEIVSGFGRLGTSAESLAKTAAHRMAGYLGSTAFAGPYLQDQLLLPFALAGGGAFTSVKLSQHTLTARDVIERFLGTRVGFAQQPSGEHLVTVA